MTHVTRVSSMCRNREIFYNGKSFMSNISRGTSVWIKKKHLDTTNRIEIGTYRSAVIIKENFLKF